MRGVVRLRYDDSVAGSSRADAAVARVVTVATLTATAMIAQQVASIATRDALFLTSYPATALPPVMAASAVASFAVVIVMARLMTRLSPARVVPAVYAFSAALYCAEWAGAEAFPRLVAAAVFLHTAALGAASISAFWSVVNERFDPHTARKVVGRIGAGASLGGVLGGVGVWQAGSVLSLRAILLLLGALNLLCAIGVLRIGRGVPAPPVARDAAAPPSGYKVFREVPYLRHIALVIGLATIAEVSADYVFKARAAAEMSGGEGLISFFAIYYTVVGVAGFALQSLFARRALSRIGLTGTVAIYPIAVAIGNAVALVFPGLWSLTALRGTDGSLKGSLFRSGYELLYTPLTRDKKRPTKTFIDVGCSRLGGLIGSGIAMLAIAVIPAFAGRALLGLALAATLLVLIVVRYLHRGYVAALADSLRQGTVRLEAVDVQDAVTRGTLAETGAAMERESLHRQMEAAMKRMRGSGELADDAGTETGAPVAAGMAAQIEAAIEDLASGDAARVRRVTRAPPAVELVPHLIPLLATDEVHRDVIKALRVVAARTTGPLVDALLDPATPVEVRRRVPRVLARCPTQRAADGLIEGLADPMFEVRYRCAVALVRIAHDDTSLQISEHAILAAAAREAGVGVQAWTAATLTDAPAMSEELPLGDGTGQRLGRSTEHVFTLLSLVLDREPLQLAYRAIAEDDDNLRGVGLEYLDSVLPPDIRNALWPYLGDRSATRGTRRERQQILADLRRSMTSINIDRPA